MNRAALLAIVLCCPATVFPAPLSTSFTADGNLGVEVAAYPRSGSGGPGTLSLSTIPAGATIVRATLYGHNWFASPNLNATFAGNVLGNIAPFATDPVSGGLYAYQWDVTAHITGNGVYNATYSGDSNSYGLALAVVFEDPSLPGTRVFINDGSDDVGLGGGTGDAAFNTGTAGPGTLWIYAQADDNFSSGEQILYNGNVVGGPIDANLGNFASLFNIPVTSVNGVNTAQVTTQGDHFGIHLAVLTTPIEIEAVPEPASIAVWSLLLLAGMAVVWRRRRMVPSMN